MRIKLLSALALLAALALAAQQDKSYPLRAIEVEGANAFPEDRIIAETGLEIGQSVTPADFNAALVRLNAAGVFEKLEFRFAPHGDGYKVTFTVVEVEQLYDVLFQGFDDSDKELAGIVKANTPLYIGKAPGDGPMVLRIGNALQKHWNDQGHESKINGRLAPAGEDRLAMIFQPDVRIQTIAFVTFEGSQSIDPVELQRIFNPIAMGEQYSEPRLQELLHFNIRPLFEEKGLMAVKFCPCSSEPDPNTQGVLVHVQIEEGPEYHYRKVTLPENSPVEQKDIARIFDFDTPERVNMARAREAQGELDHLLARDGFIKAETGLATEVDHGERVVDLTFTIELGAQYTFNRLNVKGLDILSEPVIRKRWGLQSGRPFNPDYPSYFLDRIRDEQMFDNLTRTTSSIAINETNHTVDVTLTFVGGGDKLRPGSNPGQDQGLVSPLASIFGRPVIRACPHRVQ